MRLAIVMPSMVAGGAERVAANLANAWAERGRAVCLITLAPRSLDFYTLSPRIRRVALEVSGNSPGLGRALLANYDRIRALRRVLVEVRPDAVLAMTTHASVLAILSSAGLGCRVVVSERTYPPALPVKPLWHVLRRLTYPRARCVSMQTLGGLRWVNQHIPGARGVVIPNPVAFPLVAGNPVLPPERVVARDRRLLLGVGRLDRGKQFDRLLSSFAALAPRHEGWQLVILGEGPERTSLERLAADLGLDGRASFPGTVGNMAEWYSRADLFVLSSRYEGFPNTLLEAMSHGCPAVSYDCETGPGDIIRHDVDGLLVAPVGDVPALTEALERLMGDDGRRARLAARAAEVRSRYSTDRILSLWEEALGAPGGGELTAS